MQYVKNINTFKKLHCDIVERLAECKNIVSCRIILNYKYKMGENIKSKKTKLVVKEYSQEEGH